MNGKKFKIGDAFGAQAIVYGAVQVDEEDETTGAYGCSSHYITREDIQHLLKGGILLFEDGEYEHYLKLSD
jgi:hypothetical protein